MCLHQQLMKKTVCVSFVLTIYKLGLRERERTGEEYFTRPIKGTWCIYSIREMDIVIIIQETEDKCYFIEKIQA